MIRALQLQLLEDRLAPALAIWDGGGADNNWTSPANWVGDVAPQPLDDLAFPAGVSDTVSLNDFAVGTAFGNLLITGAGYQFSGQRISLAAGITLGSSTVFTPIAQASFSIPISLTASQSITANFQTLLNMSGPIDLNGFNLTFDIGTFAAATIAAPIGGAGALTKSSSGTLNLTSANTYAGTLHLTAGILDVSGTLPAAVSIEQTATLRGTGTTGPVTIVDGFLSPGPEQPNGGFLPGVLTTGGLNLQDRSDFTPIVTNLGTTRVIVNGAVQLGGTMFIGFAQAHNPIHVGDSVTLIQNDGTDPVSGTFQGFAEGAIVTFGQIPLRISYHGGDGNDVTVTAVSQNAFAVGAGAGGLPIVNVFDREGGLVRSFFAYDSAFRGGVRVATADMTRDGVPDVITAPGAGGGPVVRIWDGVTGLMVREFNAYNPAFRGGVNLAIARIDLDSFDDIVTGPGAGGGPHVRIFSGATFNVVGEYLAYAPGFLGGVSVAGIDGGSTHFGFYPGIVVTGAGPGGGPHVRTFTGTDAVPGLSFFAYDSSFLGGISVAVGNLVSVDDIVTAPMAGGGPVVRVFSSTVTAAGQPPLLETEFLAYAPAFVGGVTIGVRPLGYANPDVLITGAGPGGGPHVETWSMTNGAAARSQSFLAFDPAFLGGVFVG